MQDEYNNGDTVEVQAEKTVEAQTNAGSASGSDHREKKGLHRIIAAAIAVTVTVAVIVAGLLTDWFGIASGPVGSLIAAVENTLNSDSLTAEFKTVAKYDDSRDSAKMEMRILYDEKEEKLVVHMENDGSETIIDGKKLYYYSENHAYAEKIDNSYATDFFGDFRKGEELDWDDIIDELELDESIDGDGVGIFFETLMGDCLRDEEWLRRNLGFQKNKNTYSFNADVDDLLEEIVEIADEAGAVNADEEDVEEMIDEFKGVEIDVSFTVKNRNVSELFLEMYDDEYSVELSVEITDVNKTKITEEEKKEFKNKIEEWEDENTCENCGETSSSLDENGLCYDCSEHDYCDSCHEYAELYYYGGYNLCGDCYDEYSKDDDADHGYCDRCGEYGELYDWGSDDYCYDCYVEVLWE
ncbi:MAG: hypothetical protein E7647_00305 [Ruminococcaceae bacterium]|nr:hypothetical protein [Oscillospiraceae bacterium]